MTELGLRPKFLRLQSLCCKRVCRHIRRRSECGWGCGSTAHEGRVCHNYLSGCLGFLFYFVPVYPAIDVWKQRQNNKTSNEYRWNRSLSAPTMFLPIMWNSILTSKQETVWIHKSIWAMTEHPAPPHTQSTLISECKLHLLLRHIMGTFFVSISQSVSDGQEQQWARIWECDAGASEIFSVGWLEYLDYILISNNDWVWRWRKK